MSERVKPLQFTWLKRAVVVGEVLLGSVLLAWVTALIFQYFVGQAAAGGEQLTELTRAFGLLLLMGTVLFLDGLRRGRRWM